MATITVTLTEEQAEIVQAILLSAGSIASISDEDTLDSLADIFDVQGDNDYNLGLI